MLPSFAAWREPHKNKSSYSRGPPGRCFACNSEICLCRTIHINSSLSAKLESSQAAGWLFCPSGCCERQVWKSIFCSFAKQPSEMTGQQLFLISRTLILCVCARSDVETTLSERVCSGCRLHIGMAAPWPGEERSPRKMRAIIGGNSNKWRACRWGWKLSEPPSEIWCQRSQMICCRQVGTISAFLVCSLHTLPLGGCRLWFSNGVITEMQYLHYQQQRFSLIYVAEHLFYASSHTSHRSDCRNVMKIPIPILPSSYNLIKTFKQTFFHFLN